jgi:hypothetical protein
MEPQTEDTIKSAEYFCAIFAQSASNEHKMGKTCLISLLCVDLLTGFIY